MSRKYNKKLILAAINAAAYGTDAIAAGTPLAMETSSTSITPLQGEDLDRDLDDGRLGHSEALLVGTHVTFSSEVAIAGSSAPNVAAAWEPFITAAGYVATPDIDHVDYVKATENSEQDVTFYAHQDGAEHIVLGSRATFTTRIAVGEYPLMTFEVTGLFGGVSDQALPAADFSAFQQPLKVGHEHTQLIIGATPFKMLEVEITENVEIGYDENTVDERIYLTDYAPEGTLLIEAESLATFNPFTIATNHTLQNVRIIHGPVGNQVEILIPEMQFMRPEYADRNGRLAYSIPFRIIGQHSYITR